MYLNILDTGLCAYLTEWSSPKTLEAGAMSGAILETWIMAELLKGYWHNGHRAPFYYYRDKDRKEKNRSLPERLIQMAYQLLLTAPLVGIGGFNDAGVPAVGLGPPPKSPSKSALLSGVNCLEPSGLVVEQPKVIARERQRIKAAKILPKAFMFNSFQIY